MKNTEPKNYYIGFRICETDYSRTLSAAQFAGLSISDFMLFVLQPVISKYEYNTDVKQKDSLTLNQENMPSVIDEFEKNIIPAKTIAIDSVLIVKNNNISALNTILGKSTF